MSVAEGEVSLVDRPAASIHIHIDPQESRRVVLASTVGTAVEMYDFFLFALCAAFVFGPKFFPAADPFVSTLGTLGAFAAGFVARPFGGIIAGHFGDRVGRKGVLIWSFLVMGIATALIGLLPTYETAGVVAPLLLVILRVFQGFATGAEVGSALVLAIEHAPKEKRGLYGMSPVLGITLGSVLGSMVVAGGMYFAPAAFMEWGWRAAFLASLILLVLGVYARSQLAESPFFEDAENKEPPKVPLFDLLRYNFGGALRGIGLLFGPAVFSYTALTYAYGYGVTQLGLSPVVLSVMNIFLAPLYVGAQWYAARTGDVVGRRRLLLILIPVGIVTMGAYFPLFSMATTASVAVAHVLAVCTYYALFSLLMPLVGESFETKWRTTGVTLSYNIAWVIGGLVPILAALVTRTTGNVNWVAAILIGGLIITGFSVIAVGRSHMASTVSSKGT